MMKQDLKPIMDELKIIKNKLEYIEMTMPDKDMFLTAKESRLLEESFAREKEGKLVSAKELREKLRI